MQAEGDVIRFPAAAPAPPDFAVFFAEEHAGLYKALYFVTGNRADAAELMQDAFLKLWERWDRVSALEDATGFLFRTAMNVFHNRA
jgi:DNA-directed RNA polymerase specialized sigma24 family protein